MIATESFEKIEVNGVDDLRTWLSENHHRTESFWLVRYKKRWQQSSLIASSFLMSCSV